MKRLLILFTLIAFVTVSCAGPSKVKVGWTKPDFSQDEYEKDQDEFFFQSIEQNLDSDARWQAEVKLPFLEGLFEKPKPYPRLKEISSPS